MTIVGEVEAARAQIERLVEEDLTAPVQASFGAWMEVAYGDPEKGCKLTEEFQPGTSGTVTRAVRALALARAGHKPAARALLDTLADRSRVDAPDNALICQPWIAQGEY